MKARTMLHEQNLASTSQKLYEFGQCAILSAGAVSGLDLNQAEQAITKSKNRVLSQIAQQSLVETRTAIGSVTASYLYRMLNIKEP